MGIDFIWKDFYAVRMLIFRILQNFFGWEKQRFVFRLGRWFEEILMIGFKVDFFLSGFCFQICIQSLIIVRFGSTGIKFDLGRCGIDRVKELIGVFGFFWRKFQEFVWERFLQVLVRDGRNVMLLEEMDCLGQVLLFVMRVFVQVGFSVLIRQLGAVLIFRLFR